MVLSSGVRILIDGVIKTLVIRGPGKPVDNCHIESYNNTFINQQKLFLIETGLKSSSNSSFEKKCEWIGNIVNNGLEENIETSIADSLIQII